MHLMPFDRKFQLFVRRMVAGDQRNPARIMFYCAPAKDVSHEMIASYDRWIMVNGEINRMFRLHFVEIDWGTAENREGTRRYMKEVELKCSEIPMPPKVAFDAIGLSFLNPPPKEDRKNRKRLIVGEEF